MLKHLNIAEMVALFAPWVSNETRKALFLSIPEIAPFHAKVIDAHKAVLAVRPATAGLSPDIRALTERALVVDARHDHLAREVALALECHREHALALDPPDRDRAAICDQAYAKLFPDGLHIINASLLAESGNTARVAQLMNDEPVIPQLLKTIPAPGGTSLHDVVLRWIAVGAQLEEVEHKREEVLAKEATTPVTKATQQAARSQWFRVASQVLSSLELSDAPAEAVETIRGPIVRASDRAGKRYASGKPDDVVLDPEPAVEDSDVG